MGATGRGKEREKGGRDVDSECVPQNRVSAPPGQKKKRTRPSLAPSPFPCPGRRTATQRKNEAQPAPPQNRLSPSHATSTPNHPPRETTHRHRWKNKSLEGERGLLVGVVLGLGRLARLLDRRQLLPDLLALSRRVAFRILCMYVRMDVSHPQKQDTSVLTMWSSSLSSSTTIHRTEKKNNTDLGPRLPRALGLGGQLALLLLVGRVQLLHLLLGRLLGLLLSLLRLYFFRGGVGVVY